MSFFIAVPRRQVTCLLDFADVDIQYMLVITDYVGC